MRIIRRHFILNCIEEISAEIFHQGVKLMSMAFSAGILLQLGWERTKFPPNLL